MCIEFENLVKFVVEYEDLDKFIGIEMVMKEVLCMMLSVYGIFCRIVKIVEVNGLIILVDMFVIISFYVIYYLE